LPFGLAVTSAGIATSFGQDRNHFVTERYRHRLLQAGHCDRNVERLVAERHGELRRPFVRRPKQAIGRDAGDGRSCDCEASFARHIPSLIPLNLGHKDLL